MKSYPLIHKIGDFDAVILANGAFPTADEPLRLLREARFVGCCDGAARHWPQCDAIVGDGDSVPEALRDRLIQIEEQEDNDLTKATRYCLSKGMKRIVYLGTTGKREDHTLGNISLIVRYVQEMGIEPLLATDYGWFVVAEGESTFESFKGQQVSIFNMSCNALSSEGLLWQAYPYRQWWQGTLNESAGDSFTLKGDGFYLVYRTYQAKETARK
jgi:thiamine pyrophosphokinase